MMRASGVAVRVGGTVLSVACSTAWAQVDTSKFPEVRVHAVAASKSMFELTYTTDHAGRDGKGRKLEVSPDKVHQKAKMVVKAPERYYAPSQ